MKDCENAYMNVPCGHCPDCVQSKQAKLVQRIQSEAKYNHLFFCTLTYDNKHLPVLSFEVPTVRSSYDAEGSEPLVPFDFESYEEQLFPDRNDPLLRPNVEVLETPAGKKVVNTTPCGYLDEDEIEYEEVRFPYADIYHVQLLLKNLRDNNKTGRNLRYVAVSELGKGNGRPHFHILFLLEKFSTDFMADGRVNTGTMRNLEKQLYDMVFKYWSINVGTRKQPIYEPLFTYRKSFYGGRVHTNFDLHWVDPSLTTEGESNVAYYVSKYIMKGSERDVKRQQFLKLNLTEEEYKHVWNIVRCRMTCSKGLGLDARFETVEVHEEVRKPLYQLAEEQLAQTLELDDLPSADWRPSPYPPCYRVRTKRILIPNFELVQWIKDNLMRDVGESAQPIYISPDGIHRPLAPYYQKFGYIFSASEAIEYWMNWDPAKDVDRSALSKQDKDKVFADQERRNLIASRNSSFDTSPALLNPHEDVIYNPIADQGVACSEYHNHRSRQLLSVGCIVREWH